MRLPEVHARICRCKTRCSPIDPSSAASRLLPQPLRYEIALHGVCSRPLFQNFNSKLCVTEGAVTAGSILAMNRSSNLSGLDMPKARHARNQLVRIACSGAVEKMADLGVRKMVRSRRYIDQRSQVVHGFVLPSSGCSNLTRPPTHLRRIGDRSTVECCALAAGVS